MYWLYPSEQFHNRLDSLYSSHESVPSMSWLCSLYSILAMSPGVDSSDESSEAEADALKYLNLAKSLIPEVYDEADLDSVRALILIVSIPKIKISAHFFHQLLTFLLLVVGIANALLLQQRVLIRRHCCTCRLYIGYACGQIFNHTWVGAEGTGKEDLVESLRL